jgi:hypothetical protein
MIINTNKNFEKNYLILCTKKDYSNFIKLNGQNLFIFFLIS